MPIATWLNAAANYFRNELHQHRVFTADQLRKILQEHRQVLGAPQSLSAPAFAKALDKQGVLKRIEVLSAETRRKEVLQSYKPFIRYVWPDVTAHQVAISLRPGSYFSHGTAAYLHGLMPEHDGTIYVNKEQSPKPDASTTMSQDAIDLAFRNPPRVSNYIYKFNSERMVLISGKSTGGYGVVETQDKSGFPIRLTSVERTLVDIAVRPVYAGGVVSVLSAYRNALGTASKALGSASVEKIVHVIRKLGHAYPYHQAIGFYLQRAGLPNDQTSQLHAFGLNFNFYLANGMKEATLNPDWRLYIPRDLST